MIDGFLRDNSKDLGKLQVFLDPLFISLLFNKFYYSLGEANNSYVFLLIFFVSYIVISTGNLYQSYRNKSILSITLSVFKIWLILFFVLFIIDCLFLESTLRSSIYVWSFFSLIWLLTSHAFLRLILRFSRKFGRNSRNFIFLGPLDKFKNLVYETSKNKWLGISPEGWFTFKKISDLDPKFNSIYLGSIQDMKKWFLTNETDYIIFSESDPNKITDLLSIFSEESSPVFYLPPWNDYHLNIKKFNVGSTNLIEIWNNEKSNFDLKFKRIFDLILSTLLIIIISPILILTSLILFFDKSGPIIFKQERYGLNGKRFQIFKFRSMKITERGDKKGLKHAQKDDQRFTVFGKFIRRWSIDELPQLVNVFIGNMSLVGPRPHAVDHNEYYKKLIPGYTRRHIIKPGMTGLAQVEGWRGEIRNINDMERRINADMRYSENWSFYLDLKILLRTFFSIRGV